jgi:shikimate kinase
MENFYKNIVLIGMPGCGKTLIGKMLSKKLSRNYIDLDEYIEKTEGCTITEIFKNGEEYFRDLESESVIMASKLKSSIISTGGGVIKRAVNIEHLKENGIIFFIDKAPEDIVCDIDISTRPLLKDSIQNVYKLFNERYEIYKSSCDIIIKENGKTQEIVEKIIELYNSICTN